MTCPLLAVTVSSSAPEPAALPVAPWDRRVGRWSRLDVGCRSVSRADPCLCDGCVLHVGDVVGAASGGRPFPWRCGDGQLHPTAPNCNLKLHCCPPHAASHQRPVLTHGLSAHHPIPSTMANANVNWRTINIDALDPDSPANFDLSSLTPAVAPVSTADVQASAQQIRTLLRGGDNEGALQGALENPPYGADDKGKVRRRRMLPHHHARELPAVTAHASGSRRPGRDARRRETG
jgi:hypothetical protein